MIVTAVVVGTRGDVNLKLKKENPQYMEQMLDAIKGSNLVIYGTCRVTTANYRGVKEDGH